MAGGIANARAVTGDLAPVARDRMDGTGAVGRDRGYGGADPPAVPPGRGATETAGMMTSGD